MIPLHRFRYAQLVPTTCVALVALLAFAPDLAAQAPPQNNPPAGSSTTTPDQVLVVRGAKIYPVSGLPIDNGVLVVRAGRIEAVGKSDTITVPSGARVIDASGKVLMPGIVDSHSHIGITANPPIAGNQDGNESSGPVQPQLRAMDAINPATAGIRMAT